MNPAAFMFSVAIALFVGFQMGRHYQRVMGATVRALPDTGVPLPAGWHGKWDYNRFIAYDDNGVSRLYVAKGAGGWLSRADGSYLQDEFQTADMAIAAGLEKIAAWTPPREPKP